MNSFSSPHSAASRCGISLLEIMISIGVVGIGLIGVASLIPLAHYKAGQGVKEDRKALYGKRAYREFFVQGFDEPGSLQSSLPAAAAIPKPYWLQDIPGNNYFIYMHNTAAGPQAGPLRHQTYCFDPLWVAARREQGSVSGMTVSNNFPDILPGGVDAIQIPRVTVRAQNLSRYHEFKYRQVLTASGDANAASAAASAATVSLLTSPLNPTMSLADANEIFRIRDDFDVKEVSNPAESEFALPPTLPGVTPNYLQRTYLRSAAGGFGTKATSGGTFSWMATLVPELAANWNAAGVLLQRPINRYQLSIVLFHQRDLSGRFQEEVIAQVDTTSSQPILTGPTKQVLVNEISAPPLLPENVGVRHIRNGDWVALVQNVPPPVPMTPLDPNTIRLQWYQVIAADELDNDFDTQRELTLSGSDWKSAYPGMSRTQPIYMIYLRNVAAVYEKTISLQ